jgi:preprotein translocase subunit SecF
MKRVIHFSNARRYFFAFSAALVLLGVVGYVANGGFNLGVDFRAGIAIQFQIAPPSFAIQYTGTDRAEVTMPTGETALTQKGDFIVTLTNPQSGNRQPYPFLFSDYKTVGDLTAALAKVPGVSVQVTGDPALPSSALIPPTTIADIAGKSFTLNTAPTRGPGAAIAMADIRSVLGPMGQFDLQAVGASGSQEFIARFAAASDDPNFQTATEGKVRGLLGATYGSDHILLKQTNFVGPRLSQSLATQSIWLVLIAVLLILLYMVFRFRPAIYGFAAVIGIMHDAVIMLGFGAVFRIEIDAATIAAVLTILGYSINDTIVIFDRVRENNNLMRGQPLRTILDTSVSQTLSRTFITSGATFLTVLSLFLLTSGSMKNFALFMMIGIVEGTYSTFISSFIVLWWTNMMDKRRKRIEMEKYGIAAPKPREEEVEEVEEEPEGEPAAFAPGQIEPALAGGLAPQEAVPAGAEGPAAPASPADASAAGEAAPLSATPQPQAKVLSHPGGQVQGYRRHKRYKRRHH